MRPPHFWPEGALEEVSTRKNCSRNDNAPQLSHTVKGGIETEATVYGANGRNPSPNTRRSPTREGRGEQPAGQVVSTGLIAWVTTSSTYAGEGGARDDVLGCRGVLTKGGGG